MPTGHLAMVRQERANALEQRAAQLHSALVRLLEVTTVRPRDQGRTWHGGALDRVAHVDTYRSHRARSARH